MNEGSRSVTTVDAHVGRRVRERRIALGLSGHQLAEIIGVTYQQTHKYERAVDRISAGQLHAIAHALGTPVTYFFEGLDRLHPVAAKQPRLLEVARNVAEIQDVRYQEAISQLVRALADP